MTTKELLTGKVNLRSGVENIFSKEPPEFIYILAYEESHFVGVNESWYESIDLAYQAILDEDVLCDRFKVFTTLEQVKEVMSKYKGAFPVTVEGYKTRGGYTYPFRVQIVPLHSYKRASEIQRQALKGI